MTSRRVIKGNEVVEGYPVAVELDNLPRLAIYRVGAQFFVTDDLCTHGAASLCEGFQDGEIIECPYHGGAFHIPTGRPARAPCQVGLTIYRVVVEDGWISIDVPSEP